MQEQSKAIWLLDESFAFVPPRMWKETKLLYEELIQLIGKKTVVHEIVNPILSFARLRNQIELVKPSVVITLSEWFTTELEEMFGVPVIPFKISRVNRVSSGIRTYGYLLDKSSEEWRKVVADLGLDLSAPFIFDDIGMSGKTCLATLERLGVECPQAVFAFLVVNTGERFGNPGAQKLLMKDRGALVLSGGILTTPQDDAWHLRDFHPWRGDVMVERATVESLLDISIRILGEGALTFDGSGVREMLEVTAGQSVTKDELSQAHGGGKFIHSQPSNRIRGETFLLNPPLWILPHFAHHIDVQALRTHKARIVELLMSLQALVL